MFEDLTDYTITKLANAIGTAVGDGGVTPVDPPLYSSRIHQFTNSAATPQAILSYVPTRQSLVIQNSGTGDMYICPNFSFISYDDIIEKGIKLISGESLTIDRDTNGWFAACPSASLDVRVVEVFLR